MYTSIYGGEVLIIGDLHFSDVYTGKHKAYLENCCWVLNQITKKIETVKPKAIVLLGDIIGWTETNIKDRQVLSLFCKFLKQWNEYCPVYAVRGNHDIKGYPDFMLLNDLGLLITSDSCGGYFDYYANEEAETPEVRFHIVDYGSENRELDLCKDSGCSNVILGHNNYTINGVTTWYAAHDGIELGLQRNLCGVDMVISGHIHNPSPEIYATQMPDGETCMLFYAGCPTRPVKEQNMYDSCWFVRVGYNAESESTDINPDEFKLIPSSEIFYEDFIEEKTEDELAEEVRKEALKEVLGDLLKYRISMGDPIQHIDSIPNGSPEAKAMAKSYLQTAFNRN